MQHFNGGGGRIVGLDLFRIGLALLIFLFHSRIHALHCNYGILNNFIGMGAIAMTGFFLLSGYSIALSSETKHLNERNEIISFYLKRLISIVPLYYAYALLSVLPKLIVLGTVTDVIKELILFPIESLGIQSAFSSLFSYSHNGGSWFISCILFCYLVFPLIKQLTQSISDKSRIIAVIIACLVLLYSPFIVHVFKVNSIYDNPFFRILEFFIGVLVFQLNNSKTEHKLKSFARKPVVCITISIFLIVGISVAVSLGIPRDFMLYSWIALPCFILQLFALGNMRIVALENNSVIKFLSSISFAFFLSQQTYMWKLVELFLYFIKTDTNFMRIICSLSVCLVGAIVLHYAVELPSKKYLLIKLNKSK